MSKIDISVCGGQTDAPLCRGRLGILLNFMLCSGIQRQNEGLKEN
jgi:hypothetical protein